MEINVSFDRPEDGPKAGPVTIGWFLTSDKGAVLYDAPERLIFRQTNKAHAKSASRCPAVVQMESRYFVIKSPFDLHIGFGRDDKGKAHLVNRAGVASPVRANKLNELLTLVNETEWRYLDRPTVQLVLPYCFIADELVYVTQIGTFAHYRKDPLPGTIFGGRFPLNIWPRPLMWAFEWHEPEKDIVLRRGEPLFYCQFEAEGHFLCSNCSSHWFRTFGKNGRLGNECLARNGRCSRTSRRQSKRITHRQTPFRRHQPYATTTRK